MYFAVLVLLLWSVVLYLLCWAVLYCVLSWFVRCNVLRAVLRSVLPFVVMYCAVSMCLVPRRCLEVCCEYCNDGDDNNDGQLLCCVVCAKETLVCQLRLYPLALTALRRSVLSRAVLYCADLCCATVVRRTLSLARMSSRCGGLTTQGMAQSACRRTSGLARWPPKPLSCHCGA
jgi:hypothetical protein